MALVGVGLGLTLSPTNTDALARVGNAERTQASGVAQTVRQLGGTLGIAVIGAVVIAAEPDLPGRTAGPAGSPPVSVSRRWPSRWPLWWGPRCSPAAARVIGPVLPPIDRQRPSRGMQRPTEGHHDHDS